MSQNDKKNISIKWPQYVAGLAGRVSEIKLSYISIYIFLQGLVELFQAAQL